MSANESGSGMGSGNSGPTSEIAISRPAIGEAGRTGDWRNSRPVVAMARCLAVKQDKVTCQICWVHCPDGCIARGIGPVIDLAYCKGCGICATECPADAIEMVPEAGHGSCESEEVAR